MSTKIGRMEDLKNKGKKITVTVPCDILEKIEENGKEELRKPAVQILFILKEWYKIKP